MSPSSRIKISLLCILLAGCVLTGCTVKQNKPIPTGHLPFAAAPSDQSLKYGEKLYNSLKSDYEVDSDASHSQRVVEIVDDLTRVVEVDSAHWKINIFQDPELVDIRAVHGNQLFVWSGVFSVVESDDELAALIACELSHSLAGHTVPVRFHPATELFFSVADLALTIGVATLSQGAIAIGGAGMTRYVYVEAADLDPLDREYSVEEERETTAIALLLMAHSKYSPDALANFWERVSGDRDLQEKVSPLVRDIPPPVRVALAEETFNELPDWVQDAYVHKPLPEESLFRNF